MKRLCLLLAINFILFCGLASSFGQTVKREAKAEPVLTPKDYADIFVSLDDSSVWNCEGEGCNNYLFLTQGTSYPERVGEDLAKVIAIYRLNPGDNMQPFLEYQVIKIDGNLIKFSWITYLCFPSDSPSECPLEQEHEIEIISRDQVKVKTTEIANRGNAYFIDGIVFPQKNTTWSRVLQRK